MAETPKFLNSTFLEKVLKQTGFGNDIKVTSFLTIHYNYFSEILIFENNQYKKN